MLRTEDPSLLRGENRFMNDLAVPGVLRAVFARSDAAHADLVAVHIDLPCTPERVWRTIRDAEAGTLADPWIDPPPVFENLRARRADAVAVDRVAPQAAETI